MAIIYENLRVQCGLAVEHIAGLKLKSVKNEHAYVDLSVVVHQTPESTLKLDLRGQEIAVVDISKEKVLFHGVILRANFTHGAEITIADICAVSATWWLDIRPKSRSFQDIQMTYRDIAMQVLQEYKGVQAVFANFDESIHVPVIQYEETDWQFLCRLASMCNTSVLPEFTINTPCLSFGIPEENTADTLTSEKYTVSFDKRYYEYGRELYGESKTNFIYYDVQSMENHDFRTHVQFHNQKFIICAKQAELVDSVLIFTYRLAKNPYISAKTYYNPKMRGLAIGGTVLQAENEMICLHLDIDESQNKETAYDYTWRPETGNLMYCMPEVGTRVFLYMQETDERSAVCINSIRENGEIDPDTQEPDNKYLTTAHGKRMYIKPEDMGFTSLTTGSQISISDAVGEKITSTSAFTITAAEAVSIEGRNVKLSAPREISSVKRDFGNPTVLNLCNNFDSIGTASGFKSNLPLGGNKLISFTKQNDDFNIGELEDDIISSVPLSNTLSEQVRFAAGALVTKMEGGYRNG